MRYYTWLLALLILSTSAIADPVSLKSCPPMDSASYPTQNNMGNSTYKDNSIDQIKYMVQNLSLSLSKPILDTGAGYGNASYDLLKLGAKKLYINELSADNLACIKQNMSQNIPEKTSKIHYLLGDISDPAVFKQIPNNTLGLIYSQSVIHFFSTIQIISFFKGAHNALEHDGILFLTFENRYLKEQNNLMSAIDTIEHENQIKGLSVPLDDIVAQQYNTFDISTNHAHCSATDYENTPKFIRSPGFPCSLMTTINGKPYRYQLLKPEILATILQNLGFNIIGVNQQHNEYGTITLIARKMSA